MEITVLTENTVSRRGLLAEHGLSVLVEEGGKRILFDTGQSGVYIHNAEQVGISLEGLDAIVLSHGHYDHTGGLPEFPGEVSCPVYLSGKALEDKWCLAGDGKGNRCIGVPWREDVQELERLPLVFTWEQEEIFPGIYLLGQISTTVPSEMGEKPFRILQNGRYLPDTSGAGRFCRLRPSGHSELRGKGKKDLSRRKALFFACRDASARLSAGTGGGNHYGFKGSGLYVSDTAALYRDTGHCPDENGIREELPHGGGGKAFFFVSAVNKYKFPIDIFLKLL